MDTSPIALLIAALCFLIWCTFGRGMWNLYRRSSWTLRTRAEWAFVFLCGPLVVLPVLVMYWRQWRNPPAPPATMRPHAGDTEEDLAVDAAIASRK